MNSENTYIQQLRVYLIIILCFCWNFSNAAEVKGKITDTSTGETLVGCTIYIKELKIGTTSGLDGSYLLKNIPIGTFTILGSYIGYSPIEKQLTISNSEQRSTIDFSFHPENKQISEITITANSVKNTELSARGSERNAINVINVMSARSIELSPDLTVANVIQRMSGVTVERNSTGDGQYAILRGMDKRFNYTMVNGIKIPSPDNKNRFVPLDIFPSELLDRLEVTKSLTANLEGDGIGGAVNMVMKDAPSRMQLTANLATGYNSLFFKNSYQYFDLSVISKNSPNEKYGLGYPVQIKDFSTKNLHVKSDKAVPNILGGFSFGNRFLNEKAGIMLAASYQKSTRGNASDLFNTSLDNEEKQIITNRFYTNRQNRFGIHTKLDFKLSTNHKFMWYNAFMDFVNAQVRDAVSYNTISTRLRQNHQTIYNSTFKGFHNLIQSRLNFDWAVAFGKAFNETPDNTEIKELTINKITSVDQNDGATRRWEHNSDKDISSYANIQYYIQLGNNNSLTLSTGGVFRNKDRGSYFNEYHFKPYDPNKQNPRELIRGLDYNNFDEIKFSVNSFGNLSDPLNYDATEKIYAAYLMEKLAIHNFQFIAGIRVEHTNQGYNLKFVTEGAKNEGNQEYYDILPSFSLKTKIHKNANLRLSYSKAINRPSFFEIVPYNIINEDYKERGNPDLKHTRADNLDIRYEYFPTTTEQIMIGLFFKRIQNPIEFGMMNGFGQDIFYMPMNFGDANNYGIEVDIIKYFSWLGIKANYTYTNSNITTTKMRIFNNTDTTAENKIVTEYINQTRPLFGQAEHVINLSFLLKDKRFGWDGQLSFTYTGDRLCIVSRYVNEDTWQAGYISLDASAEKKFKSGLSVFVKTSNLLNNPLIQYIKRNESNTQYINIERYQGGIVERKEYYGVNISMGLKFKF